MKITSYLTPAVNPLLLTSVVLSVLVFPCASLAIQFENVSADAGIFHSGESWGLAWGDYNGDGYPDVWVGNHRKSPTLYRNGGDGRFYAGFSAFRFDGNPGADAHGAAWADFDNDGDQDLMEVTGGSTSTNPNHYNQFYINDNATLTEQAIARGVSYPENRGRTPLWVDYNNDGMLDLVIGGAPRNGVAPSSIFKQLPSNTFVDAASETGFNCPEPVTLPLISDINGDGIFDLFCHGIVFPQRLYSLTSPQLTFLYYYTPQLTFVDDAITADFNNDLKPDLFSARYPVSQSHSLISATDTIRSRVDTSGNHAGIKFKSTGQLSVDVNVPYMTYGDIKVGAGGYTPPRYYNGTYRSRFVADPADTKNHGIYPHTEGQDTGLYLGYDPATTEWTMIMSGDRFHYYWAELVTTTEFTDLVHIGYDYSKTTNSPKLYINSGSGFINESQAANLPVDINCRSAVAGDFDNDMDLDIYMACEFQPENLPNLLLENQGDGTFQIVANAGGAEGHTTSGGSNNVAVADYDLDGFLDLYLVNGAGEPPLSFGPDQLFRNLGNTNHWLQIDLEGVNSNRDGVGAKVFVTAGGVTQLREQNNGIHTWAQNFQRLHFGLGQNTKASKIIIEWPSGQRQELSNISADQIIKIAESDSASLVGRPVYDDGNESGVFVWKETFDGPYFLHVIGDGSSTTFDINLLSDMDLADAYPVRTESGDTWDSQENWFQFHSKLTSWLDGAEFRLKPRARAWLSIEKNGAPNPRQLYVGPNRTHLMPSAWIYKVADLDPIPSYQSAGKTGLFFGVNASGDFEAQSYSQGTILNYQLELLRDSDGSFQYSSIESNDSISETTKHTRLNGLLGSGHDGIKTNLANSQLIGISYLQNDFMPLNKINPGVGNLLSYYPNAYKLPILDPYGKPNSKPWIEQRISVWKDQNTGEWHLWCQGGTSSFACAGRITSSQPINNILEYSLEPQDTFNTSDPYTIEFSLLLAASGIDGFSFEVPAGATLQLELDDPTTPALLKVGAGGWSVDAVPLDLSGW